MRTIKDLNLCDDYLFHEVMKDKSLVIGLLETVLDLQGKIQDIKYIEEEKVFRNGYTCKEAPGLELGDETIKALSKRVENVKKDEIIGGDYMTFEEKMIELAELRAEELAKMMKAAGEPIEKIARYTKLSSETIEGL